MFSGGATARETRHSERAPAGSGLVVPKQPRIDVVRGIFSVNGCETGLTYIGVRQKSHIVH